MNAYQKIWWHQTKSDHEVLKLFRAKGVNSCHQLHYLQMITEKLGKAYFWKSGKPPRKSHSSFVNFLRSLATRPDPEGTRLANLLGFGRIQDLENWIRTITPLAYELESLAPSLAGDNGPNPEYPWPRIAPTVAPANYDFDIWAKLEHQAGGRKLQKVIDAAILHFPNYA